MARFVQYVGTSDVRKVSAADLKKLGAKNPTKLVFNRGEETEVPDDLIEYLTVEPTFAGEFREVQQPEHVGAVEEVEPMTDATNAERGVEAGGDVDASTPAGSGRTRQTGNGSST